MTATAIIMSSAFLLGADHAPAAPAPAAVAAPVVITGSRGCQNCGAPACDSVKAKIRNCVPCGTPLLSRPIFSGFTTSACDSCDPCAKPSLLARLKAKFQRPDPCACPTPSCDPCALPASAMPVVPSAPAMTPAAPPKEMPKPAAPEAPKVEPKKTTMVPGLFPVTPASASKPLPIGGSSNPF